MLIFSNSTLDGWILSIRNFTDGWCCNLINSPPNYSFISLFFPKCFWTTCLICRSIFVPCRIFSSVSSVEAFCHHQLVMLDSCTHQSTDLLWLTGYELHSLTFGQLHSLWSFIVGAAHEFCKWMWAGNWILIGNILLFLWPKQTKATCNTSQRCKLIFPGWCSVSWSCNAFS